MFAVVAWPAVLGLMWLGQRQDERAAVQHAVEALTDPEKLRRKRAGYRRGTLVIVALLGTGCVYAGARGWLLNDLPAQYVGYFLYAFAGAGMLGVNVWYGGPLDPRLDPPAVAKFDELTLSRKQPSAAMQAAHFSQRYRPG